MKRKLIGTMPTDQIRLCSPGGECVEARGSNAKMIVYAVVALITTVAVCYLLKAQSK